MTGSVTHRFATLLVLLCLQIAATALAMRREPEHRFHGAALSALVWTALRREQAERRRPPWTR